MMNKLYAKLLNLLFPPKCIFCQKLLTDEQTDLCPACRAGIGEHPHEQSKIPHVADWFALWYYEENVRESLLRYKFAHRVGYAQVYGRMLAMKLYRENVSADILTWVPISARRKFRRGYDQVELIVKVLGRELGIQPVPLLKKARHTPPQSGLKDASQRRANILGAYRVLDPKVLADKRILLIDDIITTGATISECARTLLTAGAKEVICAVVAAAPHKNEKQ